MKIGFTIGKFAPLHKGHQYLIEKGLKEMDKFYVVIYETNVIDIKLKDRANWIKRLYPKVEIKYAINPPSQYGLDEKSVKIQMDYLKKVIKDLPVTHFYNSEPYGKHVAKELNIKEVQVDQTRANIPIHATEIRNNIEQYKKYLDNTIYQELKKENKKMRKIVIATNNKGKLKEVKEILTSYNLVSLKEVGCEIEVVEDKDTFEGNAKKKASEISEVLNMPCIADDTGMCIDRLNGWPGVKTARFLGDNKTDRERNIAMLEKMKDMEGEDRKVKNVCVVTYCYEDIYLEARGEVEGYISKSPRGTNGFGFDEIFELENGKTLAELTNEEKNRISARRIALESLQKQLTKI